MRQSPRYFGAAVPRRSRRRFHCLLVDDEESIRNTTKRMLTQLGLEVSVLTDGEEVVPFLRRTGQLHASAGATGGGGGGGGGGEGGGEGPSSDAEHPRPVDFILLDIVMARSDGVDVCRQLVRDYNVVIPIVAMTANTTNASLKMYRKVKFFGILSKPFSRQTIAKKIEFMCAPDGPVVAARQAEAQMLTGMNQSESLHSVWGVLDRDL